MIGLKIPFLKREAPRDFTIWDAHTHIGTDIDGFSLDADKLVRLMKSSGIEKSVAFPFHDIDAASSFEKPNEKIYLAYKKYPDNIIPFFRLDPNYAKWKEEAQKRVSQDFLGIKLHPRAQKFKISDSRARAIYDFASRENLTLFVHTGLGMGKIGQDIGSILAEFPDLKIMLGHGGMTDLHSIIDLVRSKNNRHVYFETSVVQAYDLFDLVDRVDADRIVFGSDVPYGDIEAGVEILKDISVSFGIDNESLAAIFKGNLERCIYGK